MNNLIYRLFFLMLFLALGGCVTNPPKIANYRPVYPEEKRIPPPVMGSLYQAGHELVLFEDVKARRVGDILTVLLTEKTNASKQTSTAISRTNDSSLTNPTLLGSGLRFDTPGLPNAKGRSSNLGTNMSSATEFEGTGDSSQSNSLSGSISVMVVDVLPHGNLMVKGEKWLTLNQGDEYIQIAGIVRVVDISPENTINSSQLADARITYSGKGAVNDSNAMGWLARFFISVISPF